jgi:hypothetical protein
MADAHPSNQRFDLEKLVKHSGSPLDLRDGLRQALAEIDKWKDTAKLSAQDALRLRAALGLERQRLVSWADRLSKKERDEEADQVRERIAAIDKAMQAAPADETDSAP